MSDARNALVSRDSHIWTLRIALLCCVLIILYLVHVMANRQSDIKIHVPPDLSHGATLDPGKLQKPNSYAFASYVWRGLNEWPNSGKSDYQNAIEKYKCLITPNFERWLRLNLADKSKHGELDRTRSVSEPNEIRYSPDYVNEIGNNVMTVSLIMRLQEFVSGMQIKDVGMNYSLRIIPDNRICNPMGMAVDGFVIDPTREEKDAEARSKMARAR